MDGTSHAVIIASLDAEVVNFIDRFKQEKLGTALCVYEILLSHSTEIEIQNII